jgi:tRNA pseudouridine38/39 synthase
VAFKLAYLGKKYNGYEYHKGNWTPLPTVEEVLWKALYKARLISPPGAESLEPGDISWEGTDYTKCGRTDKGVSAFGQVIGLRVRSSRPLKKRAKPVLDEEIGDTRETEDGTDEDLAEDSRLELADPPLYPSRQAVEDMDVHETSINDPEYEDALNFDPIKDEMPYCQLLNRLLPPDIRILAWCPSPPLDFSARFSCRERRYRYFFTQPAFSPIPDRLEQTINGKMPSQTKPGYLDIEAMQEAAKLFEGVHDFRNFCKVDGSKQISNFEREIFYSRIEEVKDYTDALTCLNESGLRPSESPDGNNPTVYTFTLHGSAFLWHQVRHMVAILFLVGQGLEKASIIPELMDVKTNPTRPTYEMASDAPLVLWDCIFPREGDAQRQDAMRWLYVGDGVGDGGAKYENQGLMECLWRNWREAKIDEMLAGSLMGIVARQGSNELPLVRPTPSRPVRSQKVFEGGNGPRLQGLYKPVMKKPRMDNVETINDKYAARKGFQTSEDLLDFRKLKRTAEDMK